jgi:hypothetical protein
MWFEHQRLNKNVSSYFNIILKVSIKSEFGGRLGYVELAK